MTPFKVTSTKYEVERFTGHNNFTLWRVQMKDVYDSQGLSVALKTHPCAMTNEEWLDTQACALSMIRLHFL